MLVTHIKKSLNVGDHFIETLEHTLKNLQRVEHQLVSEWQFLILLRIRWKNGRLRFACCCC